MATLLAFTGPLQDQELLFLAWPPTARDTDITTPVLVLVHLVWITQGEARPPTFKRLTGALQAKLAPCIFL